MKKWFSVFACLLVAACADRDGRPYSSSPHQSFALQITRAGTQQGWAQDRLRSLHQKTIVLEDGGIEMPGEHTDRIPDIIPFLGTPGGTSGMLGTVIVWLPRDMAKTADEAQGKINEFLTSATKAGMAEAIRDGVAPQGLVEEDGLYKIPASICRDSALCTYGLKVRHQPVESSAPEVMGGWPAWRVVGQTYIPAMEFSLGRACPGDPFDDFGVYRRISAHLPDWIFIRLGDWCSGYRDRRDAAPRRMTVPVLFQSGKPHWYFREREASPLSD